MSFVYLPELVAESLEQNTFSVGKLSDMSSSQSTRSMSSRQESGTDTLTTRPFGTTSEPSQEAIQNVGDILSNWLKSKILSSRQGSPVSHSQAQEEEKEKTTQETCGLTPFALLEKSDPSSSFWKTCEDCSRQNRSSANAEALWATPQRTLFDTLDEYWQTWPKAGMMLDGACYPQPRWERRIEEIGCGLSPEDEGWLWTTPGATDTISKTSKPRKSREHIGIKSEYLSRQVLKWHGLWRTPGANMGERGSYSRETLDEVKRTEKFSISLNDQVTAVEREWGSTPNTLDYLPPKSRQALRREYTEARKGRTRPANLRDQMSNEDNWPTPQSRDWKGPQGRAYAGEARDLPSSVMWPTPRANSGVSRKPGTGGKCLREEARKKERSITGSLNPDWVELLMGWPRYWTKLEPLPIEDFERWEQRDVWDSRWEEGTPRLTEIKKDRKDRLKAIGNGQVPQTAAMAWVLLTEGR